MIHHDMRVPSHCRGRQARGGHHTRATTELPAPRHQNQVVSEGALPKKVLGHHLGTWHLDSRSWLQLIAYNAFIALVIILHCLSYYL